MSIIIIFLLCYLSLILILIINPWLKKRLEKQIRQEAPSASGKKLEGLILQHLRLDSSFVNIPVEIAHDLGKQTKEVMEALLSLHRQRLARVMEFSPDGDPLKNLWET